MGLLDLVEQHDRVGAAPHGLGEHAALAVAHVAWRRADQAGDGVLFLEFAHVDGNHALLVAEEDVGKRQARLGLAYARRTGKQEDAERLAGRAQARKRGLDALGNGRQGRILALDAPSQQFGQVGRRASLLAGELAHGHARPVGNDARYGLGADLGLDHGSVARAEGNVGMPCFGEGLERLLPRPGGGFAFGGVFRGSFRIAFGSAFACSESFRGCVRPVEGKQPVPGLHKGLGRVALGLPFGAQRPAFGLEGFLSLLHAGKLGTGLGKIACQIRAQAPDFAFQRLDGALLVFKGSGLGALAHLDAGAGRVEQVDGLVGQEAARDVPVRELGRGRDGVAAHEDAVGLLVGALDAVEDELGALHRGFVQLDGLEAAGEGRIFFEIFLVFLPGGGREGADFAAGQGGLHEVGRVRAAGSPAGAHEHVGLVDEEDDGLGARLDLVEHALEPALEFALHAGAGLEQAEVEAKQGHALQGFGHVPFGDAQGKALDGGRLADAGLAHEDGIVLAAAGQDVHDLAYFLVAAEDGIDFAGPGPFGEVLAELGAEGLALLGRGGRAGSRGRRLLAQRRRVFLGLFGELAEALAQILAVEAPEGLHVGALGVDGGLVQKGHEHGAGAYGAEAQIQRGDKPGRLQQVQQERGEDGPSRGARAELLEGPGKRLAHPGLVDACLRQRQRDVRSRTLQRGEQEVLHGHFVVLAVHGLACGRVEHFSAVPAAPSQQRFDVHAYHGPSSPLAGGMPEGEPLRHALL